MRCLYPEGLTAEHRSEMEAYLRAHTKQVQGVQGGANSIAVQGGTAAPGQDETWQVILKEHGEEQAYYKLFTELGCVTKDNFDALLTDVGEDCPELRAYLMRYKEEKLGYQDFFADLKL